MAYLRPPVFVQKVFNPLAMRTGIGGSATLTVAGRRSGEPRQVPVVPCEHGGARYLVSARGESEWARNLRAAGVGELRQKGVTRPFRAVEIPVADRPPVIAAFRKAAGQTVAGYFRKLPDPADHPTFRLDPPG